MKKRYKLKSSVGDRYGLLTILEDLPDGTPRRVLAKCDCGNIKEFRLDSLKSGTTTSCGCSRIKNEVGKKYGKLKVIGIADKNEDGKYLFNCVCDCGEKTVVQGYYLRSGETTSCGCVKKETEEVNLREKYEENRVDGVAMHLFNDKPMKNSSTGYRGVFKYYTRVSKQERYGAWITVQGEKFYKKGFATPEDAYYNGRLKLEDKYLPKK